MFRTALRLALLAALSAGLSLAGKVFAESFDPMRPPADILSRMPESDKDVDEGGGEDAQALILRSILISSEHRVAVINDRHVHQGDRIGDAEVVSIDSTAVELLGPGGRKRLNLHAVVKRPTGAAGD